ncbi:prolyl-tRNA synthetase [Companilactobacillus farciminis]|nr:prolyl-tRNA synthetase [Companilactobacillus farciminis]
MLNNAQKDVQVYFEKDIVGDIPLTFHPNDNTKTIFIKMNDLQKFLDSLGFGYQVVSI